MELIAAAEGMIDSRIAAHLEAGETVLWQGTPSADTFFRADTKLIGSGLIAGGAALAAGLLDGFSPIIASLSGLPQLVPAAVCAAVGTMILATGWKKRGAHWAYAITDKRLMSVLGKTLVRSVPPAEIGADGLQISGNTVYWQSKTSANSYGTAPTGPEGRFIGFHGQADPQALRDLILSWREGFSARAGAAAAAFAKEMPAAAKSAANSAETASRVIRPDGATRVRHPETGLHIDVPKDWVATVKQRQDGPLKIFGITIVKRFIRDGAARPYGDAAPWNVLYVQGAPDAGLEMHIRNAPLELTLGQVMNSPMNALVQQKVLHSEPVIRQGNFKGFSITRELPEGANPIGLGNSSTSVSVRQVWLGEGQTTIEFQAMARLDQPDVQHGIDAMIASLSDEE